MEIRQTTDGRHTGDRQLTEGTPNRNMRTGLTYLKIIPFRNFKNTQNTLELVERQSKIV